MITAILATLPLGLGIALNPIAIVASILIVRTANARRNGMFFVIGWIAGLALLVVLPALLVRDQIGASRGAIAEIPAAIWIAAGGLLIAAAIHTARNRPRPGEQPPPPRWKRILDGGGVGRVLGLGGFLSTVSLKNLAFLAAAVGVIGQSALGFPELVLTLAVFLAISSLGILIPLLVRLFGGAGADVRLEAWSEWLSSHVASITAVVLVVLGVYLLGRGLADVL